MNTETTAIANFTALTTKINHLLALKKITMPDVEDMDKIERGYLGETCARLLQQLTGAERDAFLDKIELVIVPVTKKRCLGL